MGTQQVGLIGLAVMGENLALNIESRGYTMAVFNRTTAKTEKFVAGRAKGKSIVGTKTVEEFVASLEKPRRIILMVKAGPRWTTSSICSCRCWTRATCSSTAATAISPTRFAATAN